MKRALVVALVSVLVGAVGLAWVRIQSLDEDFRDERSNNLILSKRLRILAEKVTAVEVESERFKRFDRSLQGMERRLTRLKERTQCFDDDAGLGGGWVRGPLKGDVDGDGRRDEVYAVGRRGPLECRYKVLVVTHHGLLRASVSYSRVALALFLTPTALATIDTNPGLEIVMAIDRGASTEVVGVFTVRNSTLLRMVIGGADADEFSYAGSIGYGSGVNCVDPGLVVSSSRGLVEVANGKYRHDVERRFYRVAGSGFVLQRTERYGATITDRELKAFDELSEKPFASCPHRVPSI